MALVPGPVKKDFKLKEGENLTKIFVDHGDIVYGIGFEITDKNGKKRKEWFQGTKDKSTKQDEIPLDNDFVTHISGTSGTQKLEGTDEIEEICIITMRIHTNLHPGGLKLYGEEKEATEVTPFSSPLPYEGSIVGFVGWTENFLSNIGFYTSGNVVEKSRLIGDSNVDDINWYIKLKEGEWFSNITVYHGKIVDGFEFQVDNIHQKHHDTYSLEYSGSKKNPDLIPLTEDKITKIDLSYGKYKHEGTKIFTTQIASIKIYTVSKPDGYETCGHADQVSSKTDFTYEVPKDHSLVGFYGSYRLFLNSIGFIVESTKDTTYGPYGRKCD